MFIAPCVAASRKFLSGFYIVCVQRFCVHLLSFRYLLLSCSIVLFGLTTARLNKTISTTTTTTITITTTVSGQWTCHHHRGECCAGQ